MSSAGATVLRGTFKSEKDALINGAQNDLGSANRRVASANKVLSSACTEYHAAHKELTRALDRLQEISLSQEEG